MIDSCIAFGSLGIFIIILGCIYFVASDGYT